MTAMRPRREGWSAALLHPLTLTGWAVLLLNDHWLKHAHPGWLSGKLSDVAFMILAPLWLQAGWLLVCSHVRSEDPEAETGLRAPVRWSLWVSMGVVGCALVLMETTSWGDTAYRFGLGGLQYPFRLLGALIDGARLPDLEPVMATRDLTDLLCLPALAGAWWIGTSSHRRSQPEMREPFDASETKASASC